MQILFCIISKGHNGLAAAQLIELLEEGEPKIAVIGPTISGSLTITGQIVPVYNTMEVTTIYLMIVIEHNNIIRAHVKHIQITRLIPKVDQRQITQLN